MLNRALGARARFFAAALLVASVTPLAACSTGRTRPGQAISHQVVVNLTNNLEPPSDVTVYAEASAKRLLVGTVAPLDLTPQPGLADVAGLVDGVRRAGVTVHLSLLDSPEVTPAVGLCAYRIVQEALSNATRHAPGAEVTVAIHQDGDQLDLAVANGPARSAGRGHGSGQGLVGMRERVDLLAGSLTTGTTAGGGYEVHARLPLAPTS